MKEGIVAAKPPEAGGGAPPAAAVDGTAAAGDDVPAGVGGGTPAVAGGEAATVAEVAAGSVVGKGRASSPGASISGCVKFRVCRDDVVMKLKAEVAYQADLDRLWWQAVIATPPYMQTTCGSSKQCGPKEAEAEPTSSEVIAEPVRGKKRVHRKRPASAISAVADGGHRAESSSSNEQAEKTDSNPSRKSRRSIAPRRNPSPSLPSPAAAESNLNWMFDGYKSSSESEYSDNISCQPSTGDKAPGGCRSKFSEAVGTG